MQRWRERKIQKLPSPAMTNVPVRRLVLKLASFSSVLSQNTGVRFGEALVCHRTTAVLLCLESLWEDMS